MPITLSPSNSDRQVFKVAAVQAEPAWLDLQGGVDKVIRIVREAAAEGAKIIGFPELFVPGYPWTLWANNFLVTSQVVNEYQANALPLHSPEMDRIREAVKAADATIVLGFAERDGASLYIAQVTILPDGRIANHRRKMKATHYEKTIFADGNAQSLYNVVQTPYGRLGSLNCWEHMQPWLKTHFYSQYPQIFVGGWPPAFAPGTGGSPYILSGEACSRMTQNVSMEGGCFGLCCCHVVSEAGAEKMKLTGFPWFTFPGGGFSAIYGPDGGALTEPVDPGVETIVYADISLSKIGEVKLVADTMGNYSRFDLLHTEVHGQNWAPVTYSLSAEAKNNEVTPNEINNRESSQTFTYNRAVSEESKV
ncbi:nitrilase [Mucidula mucida]|nr:nitrilase [Mucidula mucida]